MQLWFWNHYSCIHKYIQLIYISSVDMALPESFSMNGNSRNVPSVEEAPQLLEGGGKLEVKSFICYSLHINSMFHFFFWNWNFDTGYMIFVFSLIIMDFSGTIEVNFILNWAEQWLQFECFYFPQLKRWGIL